MSTKTSFKRIALVAVAAMGLGVLTSIAPASAADTTTVATLVMNTPSITANVGAEAKSTFSITSGGTYSTGDTVTLTMAVTSSPTGSTIAVENANVSQTAASAAGKAVINDAGEVTTWTDAVNATPTPDSYVLTAATAAIAEATVAGTVSMKADRPGTYVLTLTASDTTGATKTATLTVVARSLSYTTGDGAAATPFDTGLGIAGAYNTVTVTGYSTQESGVRALVTVEGAAATISTGGTVAADFKSTLIDAASNAAVVVKTPQAGTVTVKLFNETGSGTGIFSQTAANTVTITVGTAAQTGIISSTKSASVIHTGATFAASASDALVDDLVSVDGTSASTSTASAVVKVTLTDAAGTIGTTNVAGTVGVSITGPGTIKLAAGSDSGSSTGERLASQAITNSQALYVRVFPDGSAGITTVTITVTGTTGTYSATKTLVFRGSAKTITAKAFEPHVGVGTVTEAIEIIAKDSAGNVTTGSFTALSSDATKLASSVSACAQSSGSAGDLLAGKTKGAYYCSVTGVAAGKATLTINPASTSTNSPTVDFVVTKGVATTVTLTTDKATYAPGEKITLVLTAKDADGVLIGKGAAVYDLLAADSTVKNASLTGTAFTNAAFDLSAGVAETTYYAPYGAGSITFQAILSDNSAVATAIQGKVLTATVNVANASSAELTQLTTLVNSLIKKINSMQSLLNKIQKKLGVK